MNTNNFYNQEKVNDVYLQTYVVFFKVSCMFIPAEIFIQGCFWDIGNINVAETLKD